MQEEIHLCKIQRKKQIPSKLEDGYLETSWELGNDRKKPYTLNTRQMFWIICRTWEEIV